jgi:hypothetical protein
MSWGTQSRSEDAKTPSGPRAMSDKPEPDRCPVQPYAKDCAKDCAKACTKGCAKD